MRRQLLVPFIAGLFILTHCSKDSNPTNPGSPTVTKKDMASQTHTLINQYRASKGLPALRYNNSIADIALTHSRNMAAGTVEFSHDGFDNRAQAIAKILQISSAAENVAWNRGYQNPVEAAVEGWLESPGHHANIVGEYNTTGIGVALNQDGEYYFTQLFVKTN